MLVVLEGKLLLEPKSVVERFLVPVLSSPNDALDSDGVAASASSLSSLACSGETAFPLGAETGVLFSSLSTNAPDTTIELLVERRTPVGLMARAWGL